MKFYLKVKEDDGTWGDWIGPKDTAEELVRQWDEKFNNIKFKNFTFSVWYGSIENGNLLKILRYQPPIEVVNIIPGATY